MNNSPLYNHIRHDHFGRREFKSDVSGSGNRDGVTVKFHIEFLPVESSGGLDGFGGDDVGAEVLAGHDVEFENVGKDGGSKVEVLGFGEGDYGVEGCVGWCKSVEDEPSAMI